MKQREAYSLFLAVFLLTFAVLLISGAPRLIASPSDAPPAVYAMLYPTELCSAPSAPSESGNAEDMQRAGSVRREDVAHISAHASASVQPAPGADANGNVLVCVSYMRSVYHAFALGDGFV